MPPIIEVDRLSKSYSSGKRLIYALKEASLSIEKGDIYGLIGFSGAGKSTFIRSLAKLITPSSGKILFNGIDLSHMTREELRTFRKKVGMIFQHFNLLSSRTVAGNIAYPMEIAGFSKEMQEERVNELLDLVSLSSKRDAYPSTLSGGEKQRVGIARALATHPEVLLCDEATSALDPKTSKEILQLLRRVHQKLGVTIVLITHQMEVIRQICNKVAVMEEGRIVESGLVSTLFANPQHKTTEELLESASHELPKELFHSPSPNRKLLRLRFKGESAAEPVISQIVKQFEVNANILLGWIDRLQTLSIGTLVIEFTGEPSEINKAIAYLELKNVHHEVLDGS